jgi:hypothetical protein
MHVQHGSSFPLHGLGGTYVRHLACVQHASNLFDSAKF